MNEIQFYSYMSIPVAEQRSSTREPIRLASPGIVWRTIASQVRAAIEMFEQSVTWATKEATYCNYNPAECRGVA